MIFPKFKTMKPNKLHNMQQDAHYLLTCHFAVNILSNGSPELESCYFYGSFSSVLIYVPIVLCFYYQDNNN